MRARLFVMLLCVAAMAACGDSDSSTPTPPIGPTPPPTPSPTTITMDGTVRETPPTPDTPVPGATIRITTGAQQGQTRQADGNGYYVFDGLTPGSFTVEISAPNYVTATTSVTRETSGSQHFTLTPAQRDIDQTFTGDLHSGSPRCDTGVGSMPCVVIPFTLRYSGHIEANLDWTPSTVNLDLELYRGSVRVAASENVTLSYEAIAPPAEPGAYELRAYHRDGLGARYSLRVRRPN